MKRLCTGCNQEKPLDSDHFTKDKHDKSGFTYRCKICRGKAHKEWSLKNPEKVKALNEKNKDVRKAYYARPEIKMKYRKKAIEHAFKIKYEQYEEMLEEQNNVCAICKKPETCTKLNFLSVDHDHSTGKIRGLLCRACNHGIGNFLDSVENLTEAIHYLNKNK